MMDVSNGQLRIRKWPRPRGKAKTQEELDRQRLFTAMQWASKFMSPQMMVDIMKAREGTPILPRDVTTAMLSGTLMSIITIEGKELWPVAGKNKVSDALDAITQTEGETIRRGATGWEGAPYGGGSGAAMFTAGLYRSTAINTTNVGWQAVPFNAVVDDVPAWSALPTAGIRPSLPGWYAVLCHVRLATAGFSGIAVTKNGALNLVVGTDTGGNILGHGGIGLVWCNGTTDYLGAMIYTTSVRAYVNTAIETYLRVFGPLAA